METKTQEPQQMKDQPKEPNPQNEELTKTLQELRMQNEELVKRLDAKEKAEHEAQEKAKQEKLGKDTNLEKLLRSMSDGSGEPKEPAKPKDYDSLTNSEMLELLTGSVERYVAARLEQESEKYSKPLEETTQRLAATEKTMAQLIAQQSVSHLRVQYPDLDDYREDIVKIVERNPSYSLEDAYKIAKADRLTKEPRPNEVETELPMRSMTPFGGSRDVSATTKEPRSSRDRTEPMAPRQRGVAAFRDIVDAGLERVLANRSS